jgi:hypothetical protein
MKPLAEPHQARTFEEIVQAYGLTILQEPADWSLENGDLALTPDGDIKVGTTAYNSLFRLVQLWRYNEPHLRYLFDAANDMLRWCALLKEELNAIGFDRRAVMSTDPWAGFERFAEAFRSTTDTRGIAHFGSNTYAGCLLIALSNALLRFRTDIAAGEAWKSASPSFNGYSVGRIIVAAANGYRHEDEWSKTQELDDRQKALV